MFIDQFESIFNQVLGIFPEFLRPLISIILAIVLVYSVFQVLKKNFIFIIVLIILLPASVSILKNVLDGVIHLVAFLLGR